MYLIAVPGRVSQTAAAVVLATVIIATGAVSARADDGLGWVSCGASGRPSCDIGAQAPGSSRQATPRPAGDSTTQGSGTADQCLDALGNVALCFDPQAGWLGSDGCYYKSAPTPPAQELAALGGTGSGPGGWYTFTCPGMPGTGGGTRWVPGDAPGLPAAPDPAVLARQAVNHLALPSLSISFSPTGRQLVRLPMWLWIDPVQWTARSASAAVPGVVVTATATPTRVVWSTGDGTSVSCAGPGTPWRAGTDPSAGSPTCGHVYALGSAGAPGGRFTVSATVWWSIAWTSGGQGDGTLPDLSTTATTTVRVDEVQAIVVPG
jgi:hypothetical protein